MRTSILCAGSALLTTALAAPSFISPRDSCPGDPYPAGAISPNSLVPIAKSNPDHAYGIVTTGVVTPDDFCTIVDLLIPDYIDGESTLLKTCTLSLSLPSSSQASPHTVEFSGPGHFTFTGYLTGFGADESTTYNKQPVLGPSPPFPPSVIVPGSSYVIATLPCGILPGSGGQTVAGALCSKDTSLKWEQTGPGGDGGCPLGFFVVVT
ncbi:ubiquitin 3 binding protein But2 C-terminal domain-containing protein [Lophiotrema nucula]|uniref:Ubiquitin 3 binding protein But2 C-terminal domain-containing protein n=1 Tax=Lophiotrema nucula TaxID=690887 RepID=A0A6A5YNR2_9PLEO|nr:ubiquitin 3 binding protein But2 C-terminal domain-containing protein [Lophiotrema nucula]